MQNFVQTGDVLDLDPGADVPAGVGHLFGSVFGVAAVDAVSGMPSSFVVAGVVAIAKTSALAVDVGDALYWDATAREVNKTTTDQQQVGIAIAAAANPSPTVQMLLRGAPVSAPGGAAAFTDLSDAPGTITPLAPLLGNAAGDALEFGTTVQVRSIATVENDAASRMWLLSDTNEAGSNPSGLLLAAAGANANGCSAALDLVADTSNGQAGIHFYATFGNDIGTGVCGMYKANTDFAMSNFDVVASDTSARLTVDAVEYSIAKAIKVKIGDDTYFWPLFGPVAP